MCLCVCVYAIAAVEDANGERRRGRDGNAEARRERCEFVDGERWRKQRGEDERKGVSSVPRQGALRARPLAGHCPLALLVCLCACVAMQRRQCPSSHTRQTEEGREGKRVRPLCVRAVENGERCRGAHVRKCGRALFSMCIYIYIHQTHGVVPCAHMLQIKPRHHLCTMASREEDEEQRKRETRRPP